MREWADFSVEQTAGGGCRLVLSGPLLVSTVGVPLVPLAFSCTGAALLAISFSFCTVPDTVTCWPTYCRRSTSCPVSW
jgi:hypothetical protein